MVVVIERRVLVTRRAATHLNATADWIEERAPETAARWFADFAAKIKSLSTTASSCPLDRENRRMPFELREMSFGRRRYWRVLFTIRGNDVLVMAVRHAAQKDVTLDDLIGLEEAYRAACGSYPRFGASQRSTSSTLIPFRRA
jgi:plasmid stabilization system protein ParE